MQKSVEKKELKKKLTYESFSKKTVLEHLYMETRSLIFLQRNDKKGK